MNTQAIYHKADSSYAYMKDVATMCITLRTGKDVKAVSLITDHPDGWVKQAEQYYWKKEQISMNCLYETSQFLYWQVDHKPVNHQMRYGFIVQSNKDKRLIIERGIFSQEDSFIQNDINSYFAFPYMHESEVFQAPSWVKETIWYQIMPDRFFNPNDLCWGHKNELGQYNFHGGTIKGITEKLLYLSSLGITGIYLTPIFQSTTAHKYDTIDYFEIDSRLGTKEDFKELVTSLHQLNMRIILDGVFNHIGDQSRFFEDVLINGEDSNYKNWFYIDHFPIENEDGKRLSENYRHFTPNMPKLNTLNREVQTYLLDVAEYWVKEFDIDGWRLDVVNEIDHSFLRKLRKRIKAVKPSIYIVGEIWHNADPWLLGDQLDGVMNYPLTKPVLEWLAAERIDGVTFQAQFVKALTQYSENVNEGMLSLLDSHDTERLVTYTRFKQYKVEVCLILLYLLPGSICLYYGTEAGLSGAEDPDNRKPMIWNQATGLQYVSLISKLAHYRKKYLEAFAGNQFIFLYVDPERMILKKESVHNEIFLIINYSIERFTFDTGVLAGREVFDILKGHLVQIKHTTTVGPHQSNLYLLEKNII